MGRVMSPNDAMIGSDTDKLDCDPTKLAVFHNQQRKLISPIQFSEIKVDTKLKFMFLIICGKNKDILRL